MSSNFLHKTFHLLSVLVVLSLFVISCDDDEENTGVTAREVTLTFDSFSVAEYTCDQSFTKDNITLSFEPSYGHEEDCANDADYCNFGAMNGKLAIGVGRVLFDVSKLGNLKKVTVRLTDYCGVNCAKVILLDERGETIAIQGNTTYIDPESITFDNNLDNVHSVAVSGCECHIESLTINYES